MDYGDQYRGGMKRICLFVNMKDLLFNPVSLNPKEVFFRYAEYSIETNELEIYLDHSEFEILEDGWRCCRYSLKHARYRFPYLFVDTNPLLYRSFYRKDSWYCLRK